MEVYFKALKDEAFFGVGGLFKNFIRTAKQLIAFSEDMGR